MDETPEQFKLSSFVFDKLKQALNNRLLYLSMKYAGTDKLMPMLNDLRWLGMQRNIMAIWGDHRKISKFILDEEFLDTRLDFLTDVTIMLKVRLGSDGWRQLMEDIVGSMRLWDANASQDDIILSDLNISKTNPSINLIRANHWIVPIILYGIMDDTLLIVDNYLLELEQQVSSANKTSVNSNRHRLFT